MSDKIVSATDEFTRPANTTAYTAGDVVSINQTITAASNAAPIIVTCTAHGLVTGDKVTIASVGGNTAANASWTVTLLSSSLQTQWVPVTKI